MNETMKTVIEVLIVIIAIGGILVYAQQSMQASKKCEGVEPVKVEGMLKGPNEYSPSDVIHKWIYDKMGASNTPCKWSCDFNYGKLGDSCEKIG